MVRPFFLPFWSFFIAFCHALQEGEHELTPTDAFWLGLIDEPIGQADLPLVRHLAEFQEEPEAKLQTTVVLELPETPPKPEDAPAEATRPTSSGDGADTTSDK